MDLLLERLDEIEDDLMARAFLFDAPASYREGVEAAMEAVRALVTHADAAA